MTYQSTSDRRCTPLRHLNNKGDMYIIALQERRMNTRIMDGHARENIYYIRACVIKHVHPYIYNINPLTSRPGCIPGSRYTGVRVLFFVI